MLDEVALHRLGGCSGLAYGLQERRSLEHERDSQHEATDGEVVRRGVGSSSFTPCVIATATPATNTHCGEQRPNVGFPPVSERMRPIGRASRPPVGHEEEEFVARVRPGVCRLQPPAMRIA